MLKKRFIVFFTVVFFSLSLFAQQGNNTLLWRIDNKTGENPSYVFGTIHLPQKRFVVYADSVYAAIKNTDAFYNEVDLLNPDVFLDSSLIALVEEKERYIDSVAKTNTWKKLIDRVNEKYDVAIGYDNYEDFIMFSQKINEASYGENDGIEAPDVILANFARTLGKPIGGIETMQLQLGMLYDILDLMLKDSSVSLEDGAIMTKGLAEFYVAQQLDSINAVIESIAPKYRKLVFDDRNKTMADSIELYIKDQSGFFAIGAGHLGGEWGVIEYLRKKGFTVSPVHSANKISMLIIKDIFMLQREFLRETLSPPAEEIDMNEIDSLEETPVFIDAPVSKEMQLPPPPPVKKAEKRKNKKP